MPLLFLKAPLSVSSQSHPPNLQRWFLRASLNSSPAYLRAASFTNSLDEAFTMFVCYLLHFLSVKLCCSMKEMKIICILSCCHNFKIATKLLLCWQLTLGIIILTAHFHFVLVIYQQLIHI